MWGIISCYWNISSVGWLLHYKLVSVGFLVLLSLWRSLNKSTFWDISFFSVFLLRPAQLLLESRHSHNHSWLILARKWLWRWKGNVFSLRRGGRHYALISRWSEVWALEKATEGLEQRYSRESLHLSIETPVPDPKSNTKCTTWASPSPCHPQLSVSQALC